MVGTLEFMDLVLWGLFSALFYYFVIHKSRRDRLLEAFPGPRRPPIIGHTLDFLLIPREERLSMLIRWCVKYGPVVKTFSGTRAYKPNNCSTRFLIISDPKYVEKILTSNVHIMKGFDYDFIRPWLGDGIVMSTGQKWSHRRKMLTPAFHFKILEDFMPIMNTESLKLVNILRNKHGNGSSFDFTPFITKCTLDIICRTAMGKSMNAQDGDNLEYSQAVREIGEIIQNRAIRPWYWFDFIWKRSALLRHQERVLKILHDFTDTVIHQRKKARLVDKQAKGSTETEVTKNAASKENESIYFGTAKKRNAFLDLLLDVQEEVGDAQLSDQNIREETDNIMFAGHDTTSVAIAFAIYALGAYPQIQAKVREELESIFGDDKTRPVISEDLTKMKYLDCVIKESLRVYPSVPFIQRYLTSDLKLDENMTIPADVTLALFIYQVHKNPNYYPEPLVFKPERFSNGESRNPFAYIPFSAGPRNCIGQKFAMMEQKVIMANLLRNFKIQSLTDPNDLKIQSEIIIRSPEGIHIKLSPL